MASTAAASTRFLSPKPMYREQLIAAASVARTSSSARFRSDSAPELFSGPTLGLRRHFNYSSCRRWR